MNTRFWIPFSIVAFCLVFILSMCASHWKPVRIENDTKEFMAVDLSKYKLFEIPSAIPVEPGEKVGLLDCGKDYEFAYVSTTSNPDFVAYRIKDICNIDDCSCHIKASDLARNRSRLSVPWEKAGNVFPSGARI